MAAKEEKRGVGRPPTAEPKSKVVSTRIGGEELARFMAALETAKKELAPKGIDLTESEFLRGLLRVALAPPAKPAAAKKGR